MGEDARLGRRRPSRPPGARTRTSAATLKFEGSMRSLGRGLPRRRRARLAGFERSAGLMLATPICGGPWRRTRSVSPTNAAMRAAAAKRRPRRIALKPSGGESPPEPTRVGLLVTSAQPRPCPKRVIRRPRAALLGEMNSVTKSTSCTPFREFTMAQLAMAESRMLRYVDGTGLLRRGWATRALARAGQARRRIPRMQLAAWRGMMSAS